jgi:hypothetical protein
LTHLNVSVNPYALGLGDYLLQRRSEELILRIIVSEFCLCVCEFVRL